MSNNETYDAITKPDIFGKAVIARQYAVTGKEMEEAIDLVKKYGVRIVSTSGTATGTKVYIGDTDVELKLVSEAKITIDAEKEINKVELKVLLPRLSVYVPANGVTVTVEEI